LRVKVQDTYWRGMREGVEGVSREGRAIFKWWFVVESG